MHEDFKTIFSEYQWGVKKGHGAQRFLVPVMKKLNKIRDEKGIFVAIPNSLPKTFDCISRQLLQTKLNAYSLDQNIYL